MTDAGFPHSDIDGSLRPYRSPSRFRRLVRPSSVPSGQAFAVRPSLLDLFRVFRDFSSSV